MDERALHNKYLAAAAKDLGVESSQDYAVLQDHGYRGPYGGLSARNIHARKGPEKSLKILDHMGPNSRQPLPRNADRGKAEA